MKDRFSDIVFYTKDHCPGLRLTVPSVSVAKKKTYRTAVFNVHATAIIKKMGYKTCVVGKTGKKTVFLFSRLDDGYKISFEGSNARVVCSRAHQNPHAAVPVEIDGDYFIAKFD